MKKLVCILIVVLMLCACAKDTKEPQNEISSDRSENSGSTVEEQIEEDVPVLNGWTPDFEPSDFESAEEYEKAFLDEYVKQLEPIEYYETNEKFPAVIMEIFDNIIEKETYDFLKCKELIRIEVFGDENEFFASYQYITYEGAEEYLNIRIRKTEEGKYGLLLRGGGAPGAHGLEKTDISLEDLL